MKWNRIKYLLLKELKGVIRDKRTFLTMVIIPLIFFPLLIGGMTYFQLQAHEKDAATVAEIFIMNKDAAPELVEFIEESKQFEIIKGDIDAEKDLESGLIDLTLEIVPGFKEKIAAGEPGQLRIAYDGTDSLSGSALDRLQGVISAYKTQVVKNRLVKLGVSTEYIEPVQYKIENKASKEEESGQFLGMMIPYFAVISIFIGAMNVGINITSGEKEKGTLSTLLVSQLSRTDVVVGKLLTLLILSSFTALLNIVGLVLAYKIVFSVMGTMDLVISLSGITILQVGLFFILLAFIISGIVILAGSFARNMKEGNSYVMPAYFSVILIGVLSMTGAFTLSTYMYLIPIVNVIFLLQDIFQMNATASQFWMSLISSGAFGVLLIYLSVRLFQKEQIIFRT